MDNPTAMRQIPAISALCVATVGRRRAAHNFLEQPREVEGIFIAEQSANLFCAQGRGAEQAAGGLNAEAYMVLHQRGAGLRLEQGGKSRRGKSGMHSNSPRLSDLERFSRTNSILSTRSRDGGLATWFSVAPLVSRRTPSRWRKACAASKKLRKECPVARAR
jgi:hypothetical protein